LNLLIEFVDYLLIAIHKKTLLLQSPRVPSIRS
jgi:hypothetical protein